MNWYASVLRPAAKRVIQVLVGPKTLNSEFTAEEVDQAKQDFFHIVLKQLNGMLESAKPTGNKFLCTPLEMTAVDIVFYNEISTVLILSKIKLRKKEFPNVFAWVSSMSEVAEISECDEKLLDVLMKYELD